MGGILQYEAGMDPRKASGILSRVYFFMTQESWPLLEAYDVFYVANRYYWTESSGFLDAATGSALLILYSMSGRVMID